MEPVLNIAADQGARERVIASAIELFAENGYTATSVREIVELAGVTKPVLYYYFGSKEGLFQSIVEYAMGLQRQVYDEALGAPGPALERLAGMFGYLQEKARQHRDLVRLMYGLLMAPSMSAPPVPVKAFSDVAQAAFMGIYREAVQEGDLKPADPEMVACLLMSLLDSLVIFDLTHPELDRSRHVSGAVEVVLKGLGARKFDHENV